MTIMPPVDPGKEALYKHIIVQVTFLLLKGRKREGTMKKLVAV
jgi:hypothetical protein